MAYDPSQGQGRGMALSGPGARGMNGPGAMMAPGGRGFSGPGAMAMSGPGAMQIQQQGLQGQQLGGMGGHQGQQMGGQGGHMGGGMQQMGSGMMPGPAGPECEVCHQGIEGQIIQAYGKNYHPDHFVCEYCSQPFPGNKFMVAPDGKLYCETDFIELHGKKCQVCNELIGGKLINIGDENGGMMAFHSEHFICVSCGTNLVGKRYRVQKSTKSVYCPGCFEKAERDLHVESHLCAKCNQMIVGHYLLINGKFIHPKHYRCQECGIEFKGGDCHEFEGDYYCKQHYENLLLKKCARCGKPCKGRSVTACNKTWHPDHFMCHVCGIILLQSNFFENDGLSYCLTDYTKLFGDNCAHCLLPIKGGGKRFLEKAYHDEHFLCNTCTKPLQPGKFTAWDNKPICTKCYNQLPDELRKTVEKRMKEEKKSKLTRQYFEKKEAKAAAKASQSPRK